MRGLDIGMVATIAALVTAVAVEGVRRVALRSNVMDIPNERSSHVVPTPRGGGLAIVAVLLLGWVWGLVALDVGLLALTLCTGVVTAISAVDDVQSLAARTRFAVQFLAVGALIAAIGPWETIAIPGLGGLAIGGIPSGALILVWGVGLTNAYNFMDGIDGIAAVQALVAGVAWAVVGGMLGAPVAGLTGGLLLGTSLGFLIHNWSPARIFMGDVGSASLGFVFAALPVLAAAHLPDTVLAARIPLAGLLFVWPFVFDAAFTFLRRLRAGENVFEAHRSHLYQRMVISGWSHRTVAMIYGVLAIASSAFGVAWLVNGSGVGAGLGFAIVVAGLLLATQAAGRSDPPTT